MGLEGCLKDVRRLSGGCGDAPGECGEAVLDVCGGCLVGVVMLSRRCEEAVMSV